MHVHAGQKCLVRRDWTREMQEWRMGHGEGVGPRPVETRGTKAEQEVHGLGVRGASIRLAICLDFDSVKMAVHSATLETRRHDVEMVVEINAHPSHGTVWLKPTPGATRRRLQVRDKAI